MSASSQQCTARYSLLHGSFQVSEVLLKELMQVKKKTTSKCENVAR